MEETRALIVNVPKPDEEGLCLTSCKLLHKHITTKKWFYKCQYGEITDVNFCKPSPGCPWWEDENEPERNER